MRSLSTAALVCVLIGLASCGTVNVDPQAYSGKWYNVYTNQWVKWFFVRNSYCLQAAYAAVPTGFTFKHSANKGSATGEKIVGTGTLNAVGTTGKFAITYDNSFLGLSWPYWVVKVGPVVNGVYDYAIVSNYLKSLSVLARDPQAFKEKYDAEVQEYLAESGFNYPPFKPVPVYQGSDCAY